MASDIKVVFEADTAPIDRAVRLLDNLEAELRDVQRAEKQGLITKKRLSQETARLNSNIDKLKTLSRGSAKDFRRFEKSLYGSGKAARANEVALQQAGYQVQDFIVQIQSGTNPLIAFSQQGSQLAGFFAGPWGAAIGLGIAAVGFMGTALLGLGEKAKTLQERVEDLADAFDTYQDVVNTNAIAQVNEQFGQTSSVLIKIQRELNNIAKINAMQSLNESISGIRENFEGFRSDLQLISIMFNTRTLSKETARLRDDIRDLSNESVPLGERLDNALNIKETLLSNVGPYAEMNSQQQEFYNSLVLIIQRMEQAKLLMENQGGGKTGYENEFAGVMEHMATQTVKELQSGYEAVQRVQMGLAKSEAARLKEAEQHNVRMVALQNAHMVVNKAVAAEQKKDQDQLYHNALLAIQNAMAQEITKAKEQKKLADETHAHMMALQNAYYADAKKQAAEVASATYLANYKAVLAYQAYGESRMAAPEDPVKPKKAGVGPKKTTIEDTIKQLQRQADKEKQLVNLTGQKRREEELFIDLKNANADADIKTSETRLRTISQEISAMEERNRVIEAARQQQEDLKSTIESSMEDAFMSIVDGTKTVEQAFKDMARQIIAELYRVLVVKKMVAAISSALPFADGGVFQGGSQVKAFANGGVVGGPTYFPMSGGKTGLMGEAGPEAIMPLKKGKDGKLGVAAEGSGGVTINQTFAFQANGDESVKKIIAQAAPKIAAMTQQQIMDSRRRGGQMKQVFG